MWRAISKNLEYYCLETQHGDMYLFHNNEPNGTSWTVTIDNNLLPNKINENSNADNFTDAANQAREILRSKLKLQQQVIQKEIKESLTAKLPI